jgi:hypothetical protein
VSSRAQKLSSNNRMELDCVEATRCFLSGRFHLWHDGAGRWVLWLCYVVNMSMKSGICDCGSNGRRDGLIWDDVKLRCKGKGTF